MKIKLQKYLTNVSRYIDVYHEFLTKEPSERDWFLLRNKSLNDIDSKMKIIGLFFFYMPAIL